MKYSGDKDNALGNMRLATMALRGLTDEYRGGRVWLDCFMSQKVLTTISPTVTTRIDKSNEDYILEIYEVADVKA